MTETLGVPPEKVVDVMALRGDAVDNIPGAPGIGDKGSVELIREFGSVEAVLDRAAEVKRKTYRESLEQNRDAVLLSKELVTIDCHVPLDLDLTAIETLEPDLEACRELFTELEFTSMLKELAPSETAVVAELIEEPTEEQSTEFYRAAEAKGFAFALDAAAHAAAVEAEDELPPAQAQFDLSGAEEKPVSFAVGVCATQGVALRLGLTADLRKLLEDGGVPKRTHDWKTALHVLDAHGVELRGAVDDTMLLSYALNPTHTTQALADVAARHGQAAPSKETAAAAAVYGLVPVLLAEAKKGGVEQGYHDIDLPLAPVLYRMEQVGVRIDAGVLGGLSSRFSVEIGRVGERIFELAGRRFNINS
ncbi:MAG: 5'-3' exonuclease H3TH domain-containing protein, partial [Terracidiphilus sp.]|nr:5'-3' exonuclease H3TH domain-containing protein [Terracidiphilus sp.]